MYSSILQSELLGDAASVLSNSVTNTPTTPRKGTSVTVPSTPHSANKRVQQFNPQASQSPYYGPAITTDHCSANLTSAISPGPRSSNYVITPKHMRQAHFNSVSSSPCASRRKLFPTAGTPTKGTNSITTPTKYSLSSFSPTSPSVSGTRRRSTYLEQFFQSTMSTSPSSHGLSSSPRPRTSQIIQAAMALKPRSIAKSPYKVLDAPELQDDFYLNLVDWSAGNILGVGLGGCVYLWDAGSSKVTKLCDLSVPPVAAAAATAGGVIPSGDTVTSLNWNPRGNLVAIGTNKGIVELWDVQAEKRVQELKGHESRNILTTGSRDRKYAFCLYFILFHLFSRYPNRTRHLKESHPASHQHRQEVCGLKWSCPPTNDNLLASGGNDNKLLIWDRANLKEPVHTFRDHQACCQGDRKIRFWNTSSTGNSGGGGGAAAAALSVVNTNSQVCNLAWSRNEDEIVSTHGFSQNQVVVWKVSTGADGKSPELSTLATLTGHTMRVLYLAVSPDNQNIVTGAGDETLRFWSVFGKSRRRKDNELNHEQMIR
ncbi:fizzy-related 3-like protein [Obelidium mucronatum]|nr:fizzy-related 3-like protein [Obelidium mucronatum]